MSSPGFLLANESNHDLLRSLLESMNAIIEHQYISKFQLETNHSAAPYLRLETPGVSSTVNTPLAHELL